MQHQYKCLECSADFKIRHNLDEVYYEVNFCPFCGSEIWESDEEELDDDE